MAPRRNPLPIRSLLLMGFIALACSGGSEELLPEASADAGTSNPDAGALALVADFSLPDVNPNSATFGQQVSPRQFTGKVSAWYFGHVT